MTAPVVIAVITALGTIIGVAYKVYSKYWSKAARIERRENELAILETKREQALRDRDMVLYRALGAHRAGLLASLRRLRR